MNGQGRILIGEPKWAVLLVPTRYVRNQLFLYFVV
jgi:hypothetical protein